MRLISGADLYHTLCTEATHKNPHALFFRAPLYPPSGKPCVHFISFFSRIRCQPNAVKNSLRILSPFIRPHHMRMPKRFGGEFFGNLGAFFQIGKQELDKAIGIDLLYAPLTIPLVYYYINSF
jgi:hypothetical protein